MRDGAMEADDEPTQTGGGTPVRADAHLATGGAPVPAGARPAAGGAPVPPEARPAAEGTPVPADARPADGEELHDGAATPPRVASTVILLRGEPHPLEVLLVRRTPRARFMAGAWVFPGGAVDPGDGPGDAGRRAAAVREVTEETGITLPDPGELIAFSNWITPAEVRIRFDTWFFLAAMPAGQTPEIDGCEIVDARWLTPADALDAAASEAMSIVFPTRKHLERLARFASAAEVLEHARGQAIEPVQPRVIGSGEQARIVLPGEPGYA